VRALAATTRFAGSEPEAGARDRCAQVLTGLGFLVHIERFEFSEFPSRWAPALISLIVAAVSLNVGHAAVVSHEPVLPLIIAMIVLVAVGFLARYLSRRGVLDFPLSRSSASNLVATRGDDEPALWLVAHLDSKSQTIPMLVRIAAVTLFAVSVVVVLAAAAVVALGESSPYAQHRAAAIAHHASLALMISGLPLIFCFIGNRSHGALDNASGVATVLLAAERMKGGNVGVLLTSAEELGLAGARAFVRDHRRRGIAINCDTMDDSGRFLFMRSRTLSAALEAAVRNAASRAGGASRGRGVSPMLPGVLADNIAFSDAGWESLTISRGNLGTLGRVHTSRDRADSIDGTGIAQAALLLVAIVEELT
jgi:hypothetical protein